MKLPLAEEEPPFVDPDFPHSYDSLKMPAAKTKSLTEKTALEWVRAIYMQGLDVFEEEKPILFENIEPSDICQGHPRGGGDSPNFP